MDALPEDWQAVPNEKEKCEEISRLTVPENLNDIDRATTLLLGGYPQQQKSVVDRCV
ncbi:TPA: hypothetical protein ACH3X1_015347 [Trebouxia sp. C0004]